MTTLSSLSAAQRITVMLDEEVRDGAQRDLNGMYLQAFYCHARAEALADAMVLIDPSNRGAWRLKASDASRRADLSRKALIDSVSAVEKSLL